MECVNIYELWEIEMQDHVREVRRIGESRIYVDTIEYIAFLVDGSMYSIFLE
ncbi:hypothetical protein [Clostridium sp. LP20]|uniref:hypothetical protein n=1 Tax=Clostridium sp. LP20 TaxID=3418665 RepID=UPI003EE48987